jgi:Pyruvate/2-oxoacid:ferredoxin oxidoreductase gamma subunit
MIQSIFITGMGGQGIITLGQIIAVSAIMNGYEVTGFANKGGAQRGGKASSLVRMYKKTDVHPLSVSTRLVSGLLNLVISLEFFETARNIHLYSRDTVIVSNSYTVVPVVNRDKGISQLEQGRLKEQLCRSSEITYFKDFTGMSREMTGDIINTNVTALGFAVKKGYLPFNEECIGNTIEQLKGRKRYETFRSIMALI